jgi:microcystin-dependent protein
MPPPVPGTVVSSGAGVGPSGDQGVSGPIGIPGDAEVGTIKAYAAAAAPASWMLCDGSAISRSAYPQLFSLIGSTYGAGDGSTTFNLPDLRSKMIVGMGQGTGLTNRVLAATGGEENHQLTIAELAQHTHVQNAHTHIQDAHYHGVGNAQGTAGGGGYQIAGSVLGNWSTLSATATNQNTTATNQNTGGGTGHNTMPPFLVITYIIKVSPTGGPTAQAPIADSTQDGLLRKLSGSASDYVGGDNQCHTMSTMVVLGGILRYVSGTQLSFLPFNGNYIRINGLFYPIPAAGITGLTNTGCYVNGVAGQTLANSTLYRVYCFNNAGTLTADFSTTAHATSATGGNIGTEIKSGDDSRTFIGLILTTGTGVFISTPQFRYVRSWVNRDSQALLFSASVSITATTMTATNVSAVFICFDGEPLMASALWFGTATASTNIIFNLQLDGVAASTAAVTTTSTTSKYENATVVGAWNVSGEGQHTIALGANVSATNTATGTGAIAGKIN